MAVQAADVLSPRGRLDRAVIWPGKSEQTVTAIVAAYIQDGNGRTEALPDSVRDQAVTAWVYYRAYDWKYQSLVALPSTVEDSDEGSSSYLVTQIEMMRALRDEALAQFEDLTATVATSEPVHPHRTVNAATTFIW